MPVQEKWWNLHFDGAIGKDGAGAGISINGPNHENYLCLYKLYFECTNNVSEYEALILGIDKLIELKIKNVFIYGDSELIINQVKGMYQEKHPIMRSYRNLVFDLLKSFEGYQLTTIPRGQNVIANALAVAASLFKIPIHTNRKYKIEVKHRPAILDNIKYCQVFDDDQQVNKFLTLSQEFENCTIDEVEVVDKNKEDPLINNIVDHEIIQLKNNYIPKGLVPLEKLFDNNDVAKNPGVKPSHEDVEDINVGTKQEPRLVKISKRLSVEAKEKYLKVLKQYQDVFACSYDDLKVYDTSVIKHTIPLTENEKPFKQKLRRVNPLLLPLIEKETRKLFDTK